MSTVIVFVRIHWFEKRLKSLGKSLLGGKSWEEILTMIIQSMIQNLADGDLEQDPVLRLSKMATNVVLVCTLHSRSNYQFKYHSTESILAGRPITLVRQGTPPSLGGIELVDPKNDAKLDATAVQPSEPSEPSEPSSEKNPPLNGTSSSTVARYSMSDVSIKSISSNNVSREDDASSELIVTNNHSGDETLENIPQENSPNTHIVFADNQRPPKKSSGVLRIPSPREFERGRYILLSRF